MGGREGGGGLDAPGLWPSQAAVATERVALLYATHFQSESAALTGLGAIGSGDLQARATPFPNARNRRQSAMSATTVINWSIRRYPSHWDGDQALTRLDRRPAHSQGNGLPAVELVVPVSVLVELGGILQGFD